MAVTPYRFPDDGEIRFRRERDLGDVVNASVRFCRETWRAWLPALALIAGPLYVVGGALQGAGLGGQGLGSIVNAAAGLLVAAGAFGYVRLYRQGEGGAETADVWDQAKGLFWPVFAFSFGCGLIAGLVVLPVLLLFAFGFAAGGVGVGGAFVAGGLALVVIAGVFAVLSPYYIAGLAARTLDEDAFSDALRRVHGLVKEDRGFAVGTSLVLLFVVGFVSVAIGGTVGAVVAFGTEFGEVTVGGGVLSGLASVVLIPFSVFFYVASAFLYDALVARVEGIEIGEGIEALAQETRLGGAEAPAAPPRPDAAEPPRAELPRPDDDSAGAGGFRGGGFRGGAS